MRGHACTLDMRARTHTQWSGVWNSCSPMATWLKNIQEPFTAVRHSHKRARCHKLLIQLIRWGTSHDFTSTSQSEIYSTTTLGNSWFTQIHTVYVYIYKRYNYIYIHTPTFTTTYLTIACPFTVQVVLPVCWIERRFYFAGTVENKVFQMNRLG